MGSDDESKRGEKQEPNGFPRDKKGKKKTTRKETTENFALLSKLLQGDSLKNSNNGFEWAVYFLLLFLNQSWVTKRTTKQTI
jgi:hypothetical protein